MPLVRIRNIRLPLSYTYEMLRYAAVQKLGVEARRVEGLRILRRAADARNKSDIHFVFTVEARIQGTPPPLRGDLDAVPESPPCLPEPCTLARRPVVVGAGPAGLFAALHLARAGTRPILIERGREAARRQKDVARFWSGNPLDPESNVQFGEGGAGTFSDGKLTSGIGDPRCGRVLSDLVEAGAPAEILWDAKPHIGTDRLRGVVENLRGMILALGGEVHFETRLTDFYEENGRLTGLAMQTPAGPAHLAADTLILAVGHSKAFLQN